MTVEVEQLRRIVEGALLAAGEPLSLKRLRGLFEQDAAPEDADFHRALETIADDCERRGFELKEVASGWRLQVREELAPWINRLWEEKPPKYSRAMLETLALIAYRQPITRGDIEEVRGVAVSSHIIKTLVEREWVKAVGHRDVPGRPALYATTRQFLDYFNLKSLDELPALGEIRDLDEFNNLLDLDDRGPAVSGQDASAAGEEDPEAADDEPAAQSEATDEAEAPETHEAREETASPETDSSEIQAADDPDDAPEADDDPARVVSLSDHRRD